MTFTKIAVIVLVGVFLLCSTGQAASSRYEGSSNSKKGGMEEFFPFMFMMMSGAPAMHMSTAWMIAALSLVSMALMAVDLTKLKAV